jgi:3-methyladenine DNA glycosylase AlkC
MPVFARGLRREDLPKLRERFESVMRNANKNPDDYEDYYRKEVEHIAVQVSEMFPEDAFQKALEMVETSAKFELIRKDITRGLLDGTI